MYRELDRQTVEYHRMLAPLAGDFSLLLMNLFFARLVARPETLRSTGLLSFDVKENEEVHERLLAHPRPKYGVPYVFPISTILNSRYPTREKLLCAYLPNRIRDCAEILRRSEHRGVAELLPEILSAWGFNHSFLWTEVLIDIAYQHPELVDLYKPFPIGPGSRPTMLRLAPDRPPEETAAALAQEGHEAMPLLSFNGKPVHLSAENWEGIGCEYRKYVNLQKGEGRKRRFA
ncbi:MAG: hypothetical protein WDN10_02935 [bacterium]